MTTMQEDVWHEIGTHSLRVEAPDIVHMRLVGDLPTAEVRRLLKIDEEFPRPENGFYAFIDISAAGHPNLEILRSDEIVQQLRKYRAFVYYRAQFQHRTVVEIVTKVSRALNLALSKVPLVAFESEAEARAWMDEHRRQTN